MLAGPIRATVLRNTSPADHGMTVPLNHEDGRGANNTQEHERETNDLVSPIPLGDV
jgi:hypothetical protein